MLPTSFALALMTGMLAALSPCGFAMLPAYLSYFRPSFHPSDRDTQKLIATWQVTLFGTASLAD